MRAAESLGYQPNPIARSLKTAKSGTVGLVIPDLTNPLFPPIVRGIEDVLSPAGYSGLIVNTDNDPGREQAQIESLRSRQVEGLIVATARRRAPAAGAAARQGVRMVLVNRRAGRRRVPPSRRTTRSASSWRSRTWPGSGHRRIAHLAGPQNTSTGVVRARAFRHAVRDHGLAEDPGLVVECAYWSERGRAPRALRRLLDSGTEFTAIVARQRPDRARLLRRVRRARHALPRRASAWSASTGCRSWTSCVRR